MTRAVCGPRATGRAALNEGGKPAAKSDARLLDLKVPPEVREVTAPHGSITVDGVSLTVNALPPSGAVQVSLIPFTRTHTTLGSAKVGDRVHVEADVLGKYVKALCRTNS